MKKIDIKGTKCKECKKGTYGEQSMWDDMDGTQTCNHCGHTAQRHQEKK